MIGQTNRDFNFIYIYILAREPSFNSPMSKITVLAIFLLKVNPLNLDSQTQAKYILVFLSSSPIEFWGKSVKGFLSYDGTNKQTDRDYNFI